MIRTGAINHALVLRPSPIVAISLLQLFRNVGVEIDRLANGRPSAESCSLDLAHQRQGLFDKHKFNRNSYSLSSNSQRARVSGSSLVFRRRRHRPTPTRCCIRCLRLPVRLRRRLTCSHGFAAASTTLVVEDPPHHHNIHGFFVFFGARHNLIDV